MSKCLSMCVCVYAVVATVAKNRSKNTYAKTVAYVVDPILLKIYVYALFEMILFF